MLLYRIIDELNKSIAEIHLSSFFYCQAIDRQINKARSKVRLCLELNEQSVSTAVSIYIQHKVCQLAQEKKYDDRIRDIVLEYLSSNANDTFLWVALVCQNLKNIPRARIRARLSS